MRISLTEMHATILRFGLPLYLADLATQQAKLEQKVNEARKMVLDLAAATGSKKTDETPMPVAKITASFRKQEGRGKRRDPLSSEGRARQIAGVKRYHARKRREKKKGRKK